MEKKDITTTKEEVYNPNEVINLFSETLAQKSTGIVTVRGIFKAGKGGSYGSFHYCSLKDEYSIHELSIKVPDGIFNSLKDGNLVELRGTMERKIGNYCSVQLVLNVTGALVMQEQTLSEDEKKRIEIRKSKSTKGYKKVDSIIESIILADGRPSVALLFAGTSITDADFNAGKDAAATQIDFREYRVSFSNPQAFVNTLKDIDTKGHDIACIIRGGGSGLEALENTDVLACVAGMKTPVISAVGHAVDKVFINEISDLEIGTPSLLGTYFKDIVEKVARMKANSTAALTRKIEAQFKDQIDTARRQNEELQRKFDELSRNSAEATRVHGEQVRTAQAQNKALQEQIARLNDSSKEAQNAYKEQNDNLQKQISEFVEMSRKKDEENSRINKELAEAIKKNGYLKNLLNQNSKNTTKPYYKWLTIALTILSAVLATMVLC